MRRDRPRRLTVLVPAHNEADQILSTLAALTAQTRQPTTVVVVADNCTDETAELARRAGVTVFETTANADKKAGALNQWLDTFLICEHPSDLIMVMDADSALYPDFIEKALTYIDRGRHAVGGVFLGKPGGGFVGMLQRNEYARYARDVQRKRGKTLVLTGTATVFTVECLQDVCAGRMDGRIPACADGEGHVYDTKALTEDNELTFALLHLGYKIIAPRECGLTTEVMETWGDLFRQRYRWKRGAVENNWHYRLTRHTAKYWRLQVWGFLGILATTVYLITLAIAVILGDLKLQPLWLGVTLVYVTERTITVWERGIKQRFLAALLIVEMPYDLCLQAVHLRAIAGAIFRTKKRW